MSEASAESPGRDVGELDVLIPTYDRPFALAVTLTGLSAQSFPHFRVVVSDQSPRAVDRFAEVATVARLLERQGRPVEFRRHLPRRGMAEQREFLLSCATAPLALFLDDDLLLEPPVLARMVSAIEREGCGFVGCAPIGLSYADDDRPQERDAFELWEGPVVPEHVLPADGSWGRHAAHNAANMLHIQEALGPFGRPEEYLAHKVAWVGGCVLFRTDALREVGGFGFWRELPPDHVGEDVLAQLRVMERFGGCGIVPSQVYHLELPTTLPDREVDAPLVLRPPREAAATRS